MIPSDLRYYINDYLPNGDFIIKEEAEKLLASLLEIDHDGVDLWMRALAIEALAALLREHQRDLRRDLRGQLIRDQIEEAVANGGAYEHSYRVDRNLWRKVADMTGADHRHVADEYEAFGRRQILLAQFHRTVAKKIGERRTADVMSEEDYLRLQASILTS